MAQAQDIGEVPTVPTNPDPFTPTQHIAYNGARIACENAKTSLDNFDEWYDYALNAKVYVEDLADYYEGEGMGNDALGASALTLARSEAVAANGTLATNILPFVNAGYSFQVDWETGWDLLEDAIAGNFIDTNISDATSHYVGRDNSYSSKATTCVGIADDMEATAATLDQEFLDWQSRQE